MKDVTRVLVAVFATLLLVSCSHGPKWSAEDVRKVYKGQTSEELLAAMGEPDRRSMRDSNEDVWEYRKPSESGGGGNLLNKAMKIGTFGMASGKNSPYLDILTVTLKKKKVMKFKYEEYVYAWTTSPGMEPER